MTTIPMLCLTSVHRGRLAPFDAFEFSSLSEAAICYAAKGGGHLQYKQANLAIKSRRLYFFEPGVSVTLNASHEGLEYEWLQLRLLCVGPGSESVRPSSSLHPDELHPSLSGRLEFRSPLEMEERLLGLIGAYRQNSLTPFRLNLKFQELLSVMIDQLLPARPASGNINGIDESMAYMHRHFADKIKLPQLAEIAGFTPTSYSREFRKRTGLTPSEYLSRLRIHKAKELLLDQRNSIKAISSLSGFGSEFYFSRMFRKETGMSPTLYMRSQTLRIATASGFKLDDMLQSIGIKPAAAVNCQRHRTMTAERHRQLVSEALQVLKQANPQLIIYDQVHEPYARLLKEIAPALPIPYSMDWTFMNREIARIVGREDELERQIRGLEHKSMRLRSVLSKRYSSESFTFGRILNQLIRIQGLRNHPFNELIYHELGLKPGLCVHPNLMNVEFSPHHYPDLETDHLFLQKPGSPEDRQLFEQIEQTLSWQAIRAVRHNRLYSADNWIGKSWSPSGRDQILNELSAMLAP